MPSTAYALVTLFGLISIVAGLAAWRLVRQPASLLGAVLPTLAAFGGLYLAGHRLGWSPGPTLRLFGFEVALPFDVALAIALALATAVLQRAVAGARRRTSVRRA